jgi:hypothetical protein
MSGRSAWLAVLGCLAAASAAAAPDARTLVEGLARQAPSNVPFIEARYSKLLREPLVVSGELTYVGAASLDRRVTSPYRETTTIRGNTVRIEREGHAVRSFALERVPQLEGFLTAFAALLGGDSTALERTFAIAANGDEAGDWTLDLAPLDERARRNVVMIRIYGSGKELRCVATGDAKESGSVMIVGDSAPAAISPTSSFDDLISHCRGQ